MLRQSLTHFAFFIKKQSLDVARRELRVQPCWRCGIFSTTAVCRKNVATTRHPFQLIVLAQEQAVSTGVEAESPFKSGQHCCESGMPCDGSQRRTAAEHCSQSSYAFLEGLFLCRFRLELCAPTRNALVGEFMVAFLLVFIASRTAVNSDFFYSSMTCFAIGAHEPHEERSSSWWLSCLSSLRQQ